MKDIITSPKIKATLGVIGALILLLLMFGAGNAIGYRRALFASRWGENYYRNFPGGFMGPMGMGVGPFNMHGVAGEVIDVSSSTISVKDLSGTEQSVALLPDTDVRGPEVRFGSGGITVGSWVTVIGAPNGQGQIQARFIRVFASSSSFPGAFHPY